jgi:hypothetical protein
MNSGSGVLHLNGTSSQSINGTQPFKVFDLNTNNSSGITLNNNLTISGTHSFIAGLIATSATPNYLVYESGATYAGADDSKHVNGWVKKIGTTDFVFPVGNANYLREIAISNLSGSSEFDSRYSGATTNTNNLTVPIKEVNPAENWTLNSASANSAQVTLNWDYSKIPIRNYAIPDLRVAQFNGTNWTNAGGTASGNISTIGTVTSGVISSFGRMVIGSVSVVLPLHFLDVKAKRYTGFTTVEWITTNEEYVDRHEIQRSLSGNNFTTIGRVPALNLREEQTYQYSDPSNLTGTVYYRIKSIDRDGKMNFSKIVAVTLADQGEAFHLLQNPVQKNIVLSASNASAGKYYYQLLSADGRVVQQGSLTYEGAGNINLPIYASVASGTYMLSFRSHTRPYLIRVVIE